MPADQMEIVFPNEESEGSLSQNIRLNESEALKGSYGG